jgi:hypothetical protein
MQNAFVVRLAAMEPLFENLSAFTSTLVKNPVALTPLVVLPLALIVFFYLKKAGDLTRLAVFALTGLSLVTLCLFVLLHKQTCNEFSTCRASVKVLTAVKNGLDNVDSAAAISNDGSAKQNQLAVVSTGISAGNFATRCVTTRKTCELLDAGGLKEGMPCYCKTAMGFFPGTAR